MNIWLISLFEPTPLDNTRPMRYMSIANEGIKRGHNIDHFACTFRHSTKVQRFEENISKNVNTNYDIHFIYGKPYKKNLSYSRVRSHKIFTKNLLSYIKTEDFKKPDVVLLAFPPISTPYKVGLWCKENNIPYIIDIIDPWPDNTYRFFPKWARGLLSLYLIPYKMKVKKLMNHSEAITGISREYINWSSNYCTHRGKKTSHFYPSVPFSEIDRKLKELPETNNTDKIRLIYAGSLEISYDIPTILNAAKKMEQKYPDQTEFVFCGAGEYASLIEKEAKSLPNINFLGRLDYEDLLAQYKKADLGLAQYTTGAAQTVTYKLFDYLAAGLPVLNSLPTEMAEIIKEHKIGMNNAPEDADKLFSNIEYYLTNKKELEKQQQKARQITTEIGDNDVVYKKFIMLIEEVAEQYSENNHKKALA